MSSSSKRADEAKGAGRRRITQADVARHAGVSAGNVSSVINDRDYGSIRVSEATRDRVRRSVRELGYVPNIAARNLARGSNRLLGVYSYQPIFPLGSRDFYYEFLIGIEQEAEAVGYNLLLVTGSKDERGRRSVYADGVNSLQLADGSLLIGADESAEELARLTEESHPFVFVGRREIPGVELSYVAADYAGGTSEIVRELTTRGHRRIAFVRNAAVHEPIPGRRAGFRDSRAPLGLSENDAPMVTLGVNRSPGTETASPDVPRVLQGLSEDDAPMVTPGVDRPAITEAAFPNVPALLTWVINERRTALVVESSPDAVAIRTAALAAGIEIPRDLALVGLSGTPEQPEVADLAELHIPRREMGREAVRLLLRLLAAPEEGPLRSTLECSLCPGTTFGS